MLEEKADLFWSGGTLCLCLRCLKHRFSHCQVLKEYILHVILRLTAVEYDRIHNYFRDIHNALAISPLVKIMTLLADMRTIVPQRTITVCTVDIMRIKRF